MASSSTFGWRLRALRQARGISQVDLARRIGRHQTVIGPYERDEYEPPREVVEKLAVILETSPEYLYFGRSPRQAVLPVAGQLDRAGLLEPLPEPADTSLISLREGQLRGYRLLDDAMAPVYRPRQIVLTLAVATEEPADQIGRDVLAELGDGRTLLRRLMPGVDRTRFDLAAYNAPLLPSVVVRSVLPVVGVLWPEAFGQPESRSTPNSFNLMVDEKF